jgi:adenylate kinase family enzyme
MRGTDPNDLDFSTIKRISVLGSSGSGKSTLARQLGSALGIEAVHLDSLNWMPGWKERPEDDFRRLAHEAALQDAWVIDGNYSRTLEERFDRSHLIVFIDASRYRCMFRVVKRRLLNQGKLRPDRAEGCREQLDLDLFKWIWTYPARKRGAMLARLEAIEDRTPVIYIENSAQRNRLLESARRQMAHTA